MSANQSTTDVTVTPRGLNGVAPKLEASEDLIARILARWDAAGVRADVPGVMRILNVVTGKCKYVVFLLLACR